MNEWKKKCVGLHRTWVSKRTVLLLIYHCFHSSPLFTCNACLFYLILEAYINSTFAALGKTGDITQQSRVQPERQSPCTLNCCFIKQQAFHSESALSNPYTIPVGSKHIFLKKISCSLPSAMLAFKDKDWFPMTAFHIDQLFSPYCL